MLICFPEAIERGSCHFGWRDEKFRLRLHLNLWKVFPKRIRIFVFIRNLLLGICSLVKKKGHCYPLPAFGTTERIFCCLCNWRPCFHPVILTLSFGENRKELQWGVEPAVVAAVADLMDVPILAAEVSTPGIGTLTLGLDMRIPETGAMTEMWR